MRLITVFLVGVLVLALIADVTESRRRRKLCRFNKKANTCTDFIPKKLRKNGKKKLGRCEKKGGTCESFQGKKRVRCFCAISFDV